jgi:hypothetical protein
MPIMQEILKMKADGTANDIQSLWLADTKPKEELYDLETDPYEINNLAENPDYFQIKKRLKTALEQWISDNEDPLSLPETELIKKLWPPNGIQPKTEKVSFEKKDELLHLKTETAGASIAYQQNDAIGKKHWMLYSEPIQISEIDSIKAVAVRIGFKQSVEERFYN